MRYEELVLAFLNGEKEGSATEGIMDVFIEDRKHTTAFILYDTIIAERNKETGKFILNTTGYNGASTNIQSMFYKYLTKDKVDEVRRDVKIGSTTLY